VQYRLLGETGCELSVLGLGTVKLGRCEQVKYPQSFQIPDDRQVRDLIDTAKGLGINVIDTAPAYGDSERRLGHVLAGQRAAWHVITKVGEDFRHGQSHFDFTPEGMIASVERSLQRLGMDYVDTLLVHSDGNDVDLIQKQGVLEVAAEIKQRGLTRFTGMSTKTVAGGCLALASSDVVMASCHQGYDDELPVLNRAAELGRGVFIKKALASGHVPFNAGENSVHKALQYVLRQAGVCSIIVGTINVQHLQANVAAIAEISDA
jgi:aryl-alcohol dehydrogenase-like predicted oxidoreductase